MPKTSTPLDQLAPLHETAPINPRHVDYYLDDTVVWRKDPDTFLVARLYGYHQHDGGPVTAYIEHEDAPVEPPSTPPATVAPELTRLDTTRRHFSFVSEDDLRIIGLAEARLRALGGGTLTDLYVLACEIDEAERTATSRGTAGA